MRRPPRTTCRQIVRPAGHPNAGWLTRTIILALRRPYELWCMIFAGQPLMLRDTEGRACRKPRISRTKLAINRSGSETEKRGKEAPEPGRAIDRGVFN